MRVRGQARTKGNPARSQRSHAGSPAGGPVFRALRKRGLFRQRSNRTLAQPDRIALTSLRQLDYLFCNNLGRGIGSIGAGDDREGRRLPPSISSKKSGATHGDLSLA